jgi:demethylmenaquinone methyltransferase/2-methoxy-6-polyprenyl-1,4-benzoquinol methylase
MSDQEFPPGTRPEGTRSEAEAARAVRSMFSAIAPRYDLLNRLLSLTFDQSWRQRTAQRLAPRLASPASRALDLCCGTADLAIELKRAGAGVVVGADFAHPMLVRAATKVAGLGTPIALAEADALKLPLADGSFDVVAAAFGFRNLANYRQGLSEIHRVLKPGGEVAILEFASPERGVFAVLYGLYFRRLLPAIGRVVSGVRGPYSYLPASVEKFPGCEEFNHWLEAAGFSSVSCERWTGGIVALHRGRKA